MIVVTKNSTTENEDSNSDLVAAYKSEIETMQAFINRLQESKNALTSKIANAKEFLITAYHENSIDSDYIIELAEILDVILTKPISGEARICFRYTANVPIDFDPEDLIISYEVLCDTYEAEYFSTDEEYFEYNSTED